MIKDQAGVSNVIVAHDSCPIYVTPAYIVVLYFGPQEPQYGENTLLRFKTLHYVNGSQKVNKEKHGKNLVLSTHKSIQLPGYHLLFYGLRYGNIQSYTMAQVISNILSQISKTYRRSKQAMLPNKSGNIDLIFPF